MCFRVVPRGIDATRLHQNPGLSNERVSAFLLVIVGQRPAEGNTPA